MTTRTPGRDPGEPAGRAGQAGPAGRAGQARPGQRPRRAAQPGGVGLLRGRHRPRRLNGSGDRFGLLLLVLITTYLLSAFLAGAWVSSLQAALFAAVALLAVRTGRIERQLARVVVTAAVIGSVVAVVLELSESGAAAGAASVWTALVLLVAAVVIMRRVLMHKVISLQSIFGAVSAYMILGLMFAAFYAAMNRFQGGGFFAAGEHADVKTFQYFSFTTLTTLGYGDFTAAGSGGQAVAVMEALFGQVFLATLVARLVAAFRPAARTGRSRAGRQRRRPPAGGLRQATAPDHRRLPGRRSRQDSAATRTSSRARARPARR